MKRMNVPVTIGPEAYASWRKTLLGVVPEAIEKRLIFDLMDNLEGRRILDVGCGYGVLVCTTASQGAESTGVDPDPEMIAAARARAGKAGLKTTFIEGQIEQLPFPDGSFDVVVAVTVLCFVPDPSGAVREMARVLRAGGRLVLGELGRYSIWAMIRCLLGWLGSAIWKEVRFRTAAELRILAENAGLTVSSVQGGVFYPPIGVFARILAPLDLWMGRLTTFGAAFIGLLAVR